MDKDEALKLALEALETTGAKSSDQWQKERKAITAIKQALAAPTVQEPVATVTSESGNPDVTMSWWHEPPLPVGTKLYTTPPAAPVQPVSGVVLRDGYPTLIQDKHIKETDQRLCILPTTPPAQPAPVALPCCGYTDAGAVKWNPFNGVVQCHNCGQTYTQPASVQDLPFGVGGGLVAIKTLLSRDPCVHANTAIEMIDSILKEHPAAQPAPVQEPLSELEKDAANLLFALHDAWPYVHGNCTIESKRKAIQALIVKHGDFADLHPPAAQRQWVGLTDEEYFEIGQRHWVTSTKIELIHAEIEAKLKEKNT